MGWTLIKIGKNKGKFIIYSTRILIGMPISRDEALKILKFGSGKKSIYDKKIEIMKFLNENGRNAWSFIEIYRGIKGDKKIFPILESAIELLSWGTEKEQYFEALLDLVDENKVVVIEKEDEMFYMAVE